jgi:hypothetical protein
VSGRRRDKRVADLRRRYAELAAAFEAADDTADSSALAAEYFSVRDALEDLLRSRPDIKVTPGELYDPREPLAGVPDSDIPTYRWAVLYFYGPLSNRRRVLEAVIHGVPGRIRTPGPVAKALKASSYAKRFSDRYGNFLANRKVIEETKLLTSDYQSEFRKDIDWDDLSK